MNITKITNTKFNQINFGLNIIDMHTHIGTHKNKAHIKPNLDIFTKQPLPNNDVVELMIVSDMDTFKGHGLDEYEGNKKALQTFKGDKSYAMLAGCAPHSGDVSHIERLMQEFPDSFIGLKFHPNDASLPVTDPKYKPYFEYARKNKLPCLFHSHINVDDHGRIFKLPDGSFDRAKADKFSDPELIYKAAKKYKDTPFIIAHLGSAWNESHDRAIDILVESVRKGDANLYADISWVDIDAKPVVDGVSPKDHIVKVIKKLKGIGDPTWDKGDQSFRLMFGTDAPLSRFYKEDSARNHYTKFVDEIKAAIRGDKDLAKDAEKIIEDLFYNNAKKLFFNKKVTEAATQITDATKKSGGGYGKIIGGIAAAVAVLGGGAYALHNKNSKNNNNSK